MKKFIARTLITAFGLSIADYLLGGVHAESYVALLIAALLLGVANAIIRPVLIVLTLPVTLLSLGLFLLVINGAMVMLVGRLMSEFTVETLGAGVLASIIVTITGWIANSVIGDTKVTVKVERK